jgi:hypothetical protein
VRQRPQAVRGLVTLAVAVVVVIVILLGHTGLGE